jgi:hypothetical protein
MRLPQLPKNMYAIYGKICIEAGESQEDWLIRVTKECAQKPGQGMNCMTMRTVLNAAAAQEQLNPPPPKCAV